MKLQAATDPSTMHLMIMLDHVRGLTMWFPCSYCSHAIQAACSHCRHTIRLIGPLPLCDMLAAPLRTIVHTTSWTQVLAKPSQKSACHCSNIHASLFALAWRVETCRVNLQRCQYGWTDRVAPMQYANRWQSICAPLLLWTSLGGRGGGTHTLGGGGG